jgi:hypothetical protein
MTKRPNAAKYWIKIPVDKKACEQIACLQNITKYTRILHMNRYRSEGGVKWKIPTSLHPHSPRGDGNTVRADDIGWGGGGYERGKRKKEKL